MCRGAIVTSFYQGYKTIRFSRRGRVLTITLDGGDGLNAIRHELHHELARVFRDAQRDPDCDVVVLTGAGRTFCAGGDADWMQEMIEAPDHFRAIGPDAKQIVFSLLEMEKPIVCRLNGAAAGLGATIALMCDIIRV
jgi:enoyl-CoA hydratase